MITTDQIESLRASAQRIVDSKQDKLHAERQRVTADTEVITQLVTAVAPALPHITEVVRVTVAPNVQRTIPHRGVRVLGVEFDTPTVPIYSWPHASAVYLSDRGVLLEVVRTMLIRLTPTGTMASMVFMSKQSTNSLTMDLSFAQVVSLRHGAAATDGYCPGRTVVQRALLRRGCVDEQYKITAFGRSIVAPSAPPSDDPPPPEAVECATCIGSGRVRDGETGESRKCLNCAGTGVGNVDAVLGLDKPLTDADRKLIADFGASSAPAVHRRVWPADTHAPCGARISRLLSESFEIEPSTDGEEGHRPVSCRACLQALNARPRFKAPPMTVGCTGRPTPDEVRASIPGRARVTVARAGLESATAHDIKNLRYGCYRHAGERNYTWGNFTGTHVDVLCAITPTEENTASSEALVDALLASVPTYTRRDDADCETKSQACGR